MESGYESIEKVGEVGRYSAFPYYHYNKLGRWCKYSAFIDSFIIIGVLKMTESINKWLFDPMVGKFVLAIVGTPILNIKNEKSIS